VKSTGYTRLCKRFFADIFTKLNVSETSKNKLLEKADISMLYQEYYSMVLMNMIIGFLVSFVSSLVLYFLIPNEWTALLMLLLSCLIPVMIGMVYIQLPSSKAKSRGKNLDRYLPYVANFINTMSAAGISPSEIFGTLSGIDLYGEVQKEAKKITTEIELMGVIQSGSELAPYFDRCVNNYMFDDLDQRKKGLESLAIMAESFVVTVVAFPLFLVIIISIMGLTSGGIDFGFLYLLAVMILPMSYAGFYVMMKSGMGEDV